MKNTEATKTTKTTECLGCEQGTAHRHIDAEDGPRETCCKHTCKS